MKIKRFFAKDMRTALAEVKESLGADAVIMSNKKVTGGVEIVAAVDTEAAPCDPRKEMQKAQMAQDMGLVQQSRRLDDDKVHLQRDLHKEARNKPLNSSLGNKFSNLLNRYQSQLTEGASHRESEQNPDSLNALLARQQKASGRQQESTFRQESSAERQNYTRRQTQTSFDSSSLPQNDAVNRKDPLEQGYGLTRNQQKKGKELENLYRQNRDDIERRDPRTHLKQDRRFEMNSQDARKTAPRHSDEIEMMRKEMLAIRRLLEHQLSGLMWQEVERKEPLRAMLIKRLENMGLSPILADQLAGYIPEETSPKDAWSELLALVSDQIITSNENILETGGVIALLGPTGVGKTTTIAKLAARAAMDFGPEEIALVTTDTFRIGAHEQLATYGRILSCPVKVAKDAEELADILYQLRHRRLILLDTAGMGQRDLRLSEQLDTLIQNSGSHIRSLLVLPATSQRRVLQETIDHFRRIPLSGCVLTKLDESLSLGEILSVTIENALPVTYLADGQRVPEDIRQASGRYLVNKASELMEQNSEQQNHFWSTDTPESYAADFYD